MNELLARGVAEFELRVDTLLKLPNLQTDTTHVKCPPSFVRSAYRVIFRDVEGVPLIFHSFDRDLHRGQACNCMLHCEKLCCRM